MVDDIESHFTYAMQKTLLVILLILVFSSAIHLLALENRLRDCSDQSACNITDQYTEITHTCYATAQIICDDRDKDLYSITRTGSSIFDIVCINRYIEVMGADDDSLFSGMFIYEVNMVC